MKLFFILSIWRLFKPVTKGNAPLNILFWNSNLVSALNFDVKVGTTPLNALSFKINSFIFESVLRTDPVKPVPFCPNLIRLVGNDKLDGIL